MSYLLLPEQAPAEGAGGESLFWSQVGGGSYAFLDLTPEGGGAVVAFIEGLPGWTGLTQSSGFVRLASSFSEYVDKLYREPDDSPPAVS